MSIKTEEIQDAIEVLEELNDEELSDEDIIAIEEFFGFGDNNE